MPTRNANIGSAGLSSASPPDPHFYTPGSYTFTPTRSGKWKFVLWGGGAAGEGTTNGGASGAYLEKTVRLTTAQSVALVIGTGAASSTATFPDTSVSTAGHGASSNTPGTASGGDVNRSGSLGGVGTANGVAGTGTGGGTGGTGISPVGGGAGAPANLPYLGGHGGSGSSGIAIGTIGGAPGGGGSSDVASGNGAPGGPGLGIVSFVSD